MTNLSFDETIHLRLDRLDLGVEELFDGVDDFVDQVLHLDLLLALHDSHNLRVEGKVSVFKHLFAGLLALFRLSE
jgi:hypothetical protein